MKKKKDKQISHTDVSNNILGNIIHWISGIYIQTYGAPKSNNCKIILRIKCTKKYDPISLMPTGESLKGHSFGFPLSPHLSKYAPFFIDTIAWTEIQTNVFSW